MSGNEKLIANPLVVLREEFDDWAILFDPDSGDGFGINPVGVLIWKCLDGKHTFKSILAEVQEKCEEVAEDAEMHVREFIQSLVERGLAGYELQEA